MKAITFAGAIAIFALGIFLVAIMFHFNHANSSSPIADNKISRDDSIANLLNVLHQQNETIYHLGHALHSKSASADCSELHDTIKRKERDIEALMKKEEATLNAIVVDIDNSRASSDHSAADHIADYLIRRTKQETECESRLGLDLVSQWRANREVWCESDSSEQLDANLVCYPLHQHHKKLDGRGPDLFCEAKNLFIDFDKVSGSFGKSKLHLGSQYLSFESGSTMSSCTKTSKYKPHLFMPHHALQMRAFADKHVPPDSTFKTIDTTTYLLARDEDCENAFHSTADFMNMMLVYLALGLQPLDVQVMLFDRHPDGPYIDLIRNAFSPKHPVIRHTEYRGKVLFKHVVFHLESPAGLIFPKVTRPDPMRCYSASLFQTYRKFILQAFNLLDVPPPPIPQVTLTLRHRTESKNVGRIMANEEQIISILKQGNMMQLNVVDFSKMSFADQMKLVRNTNVLVGIHGAGLMLIMFAAEEAVLVEIHPSYRQDRHFRHAARVTGKIYMPIRATSRETCHGSSDNVVVPEAEFRTTIDGAIRLARSFDDGLSECGLICSPELLALDGRLDPYYPQGQSKAKRTIDVRFPC